MAYKDYDFNSNRSPKRDQSSYGGQSPSARSHSRSNEKGKQPSAPYRPPYSSQPPQSTRPPKSHMNPALYFLIILLISLGLSFVLLSSANDVFAFIKDDVETVITVPEDTTVSALSKELKSKDIIHHTVLFHIFLKASDKDTNVLAGDYILNKNMDYSAIVRNLKNASADNNIVSLTIPEGYTISQIREAIKTKHICEDDAALDKALNEYRYDYAFLEDLTVKENWLEGYLFPDTYQFYINDSAINVIDKMLSNFKAKYDDNISKGAEKLGLTTNEAVTIASMIEREARVEDEFTKISGVIHNRLNHSSKFPYLQIDATVQYAIGHKDTLTAADLEIDSPYNTYKNPGLTPGPIASPGYTSLYAATHPDTHNYYYYVAMPDGSHLFAGTLSEHNRNIESAKQAFSATGGTN